MSRGYELAAASEGLVAPHWPYSLPWASRAAFPSYACFLTPFSVFGFPLFSSSPLASPYLLAMPPHSITGCVAHPLMLWSCPRLLCLGPLCDSLFCRAPCGGQQRGWGGKGRLSAPGARGGRGRAGRLRREAAYLESMIALKEHVVHLLLPLLLLTRNVLRCLQVSHVQGLELTVGKGVPLSWFLHFTLRKRKKPYSEGVFIGSLSQDEDETFCRRV